MSGAVAWLLPVIAVGVGFHLAVGWALLWRYFQARERSLLTWGIAWLLLAVHVLGMLLTHSGLGLSAGLLRDISFALAAMALFIGQVEREGRSLRSFAPVLPGAAVALSLALVAGLILGTPVLMLSATAVVLCMAGAAYLAAPPRAGRSNLTRWLLSIGFAVGALRALVIPLPIDPRLAIALEISGHALFSLFFSAAVTWQAWEHDRAVRLFSRTLETLNRPLTTHDALDAALGLVSDHLQVLNGWILLRAGGRGDATGGWVVAAATGFPGWSKHGLNGPEFPIDRCLCLRPIDRDQLVTTIADLACTRLTHETGRASGRHMTIPLGADGTVQGLMVLMVPGHRIFGQTDLEMLNAMGEQIGLALDRARLYDELKAKEEARSRLMARLITATEDERRRIARELHDETGQSLTALVVNLDFLVRHPVEEQTLRSRLADVRDMAESTLAEVRRVIHEMRPSVLDDLGLEAALRWQARRYEASGLAISVQIKGLNGRLPGHLETTVFRLVQEACTNTIKHAGATQMQIKVIRRGDRLAVSITDDGRGIDPVLASTRAGSGMGLAGLQERVALAGGTLSITRPPGGGAQVLAELPIGGDVDHDPSADLRRPHDGTAGRPHGAAVGAGH